MYDFRCAVCCHVFEAFAWLKDRDKIMCPICFNACETIWIAGSSPTIIGDEIDQVIENLSPQPKRYRSRTELKRDMDAAGVEQRVRHVGTQGGDRSPHTTRWI